MHFCLKLLQYASLIAEEKELHHPELESPEGKQEQRQPEEAHFEGEKNIQKKVVGFLFFFFFFPNCTQILNMRGGFFFYFVVLVLFSGKQQDTIERSSCIRSTKGIAFKLTGSLINHTAYLIYVTQLRRMPWWLHKTQDKGQKNQEWFSQKELLATTHGVVSIGLVIEGLN